MNKKMLSVFMIAMVCALFAANVSATATADTLCNQYSEDLSTAGGCADTNVLISMILSAIVVLLGGIILLGTIIVLLWAASKFGGVKPKNRNL